MEFPATIWVLRATYVVCNHGNTHCNNCVDAFGIIYVLYFYFSGLFRLNTCLLVAIAIHPDFLYFCKVIEHWIWYDGLGLIKHQETEDDVHNIWIRLRDNFSPVHVS